MHASTKSPALSDTPDVTCPSDVPDSERRKEVVHHEEIPGQPKSKQKIRSRLRQLRLQLVQCVRDG